MILSSDFVELIALFLWYFIVLKVGRYYCQDAWHYPSYWVGFIGCFGGNIIETLL